MRQDVYAQLDGRTEIIYVNEGFVFDYCHDDTAEEILALIESTHKQKNDEKHTKKHQICDPNVTRIVLNIQRDIIVHGTAL